MSGSGVGLKRLRQEDSYEKNFSTTYVDKAIRIILYLLYQQKYFLSMRQAYPEHGSHAEQGVRHPLQSIMLRG